MTLIESVEFPISLIGKNQASKEHWGIRHTRRGRYGSTVSILSGKRQPFDRKVGVKIVRVLGKGQRLMDESNLIGGSWKQLEDAMVSSGWFHDDSPEWVKLLSPEQDASNRTSGPMVRIEMYDLES